MPNSSFYLKTTCIDFIFISKFICIGCIVGPSTLYIGTVNQTFTGIPCQRWDSNVPHVPRREPRDGTGHNYCRYTILNITHGKCNMILLWHKELIFFMKFAAFSEVLLAKLVVCSIMLLHLK